MRDSLTPNTRDCLTLLSLLSLLSRVAHAGPGAYNARSSIKTQREFEEDAQFSAPAASIAFKSPADRFGGPGDHHPGPGARA